MTTAVHFMLVLTPDGAKRYLDREGVTDQSIQKHQAGISSRQVKTIERALTKHGFISDEPEVIEAQREWMLKGRWEIRSTALLELARGRAEDLSDEHAKVLLVTDADIYARASKSVMSLKDPDGRVVVVSTMRIRSSVQWRFIARLLMLILHGLGHTLGLGHCRNTECIMHPSRISTDVDIKSQEFCEQCREKAGKALAPETAITG